MSDCRHGGRDVYERPDNPNFDVETRNGKAYLRPRRHRMVATVVDMSRNFEDTDTSHLRTIVVHGIKYVREEE